MKIPKTFLLILLVFALALSACGTAETPEPEVVVDTEALDAAQAEIDALQAELSAAQDAGDDEAALAALQDELEAAQAAAEAAAAEAEAAVGSAQCTYNAYRMAWVMDWADAGNMVDTVFGPTSDFQYTFWQQAYPDVADQFGELTLSAYRDTNLDSRAATWQEADSLLIDEMAAVIPIYHYDRTALRSTNLEGPFPPFGAPRIAQWSYTDGSTVLRTSITSAVPTLDINRSTDTTSSFMIYQMIDAPYRFNTEGGIEPLAAESFDVSEDGTVFTVNLRQDAVWSDGEPVLAQHYVDGVKRLLSPDLANDYAYVMFDIIGAADYNAGDTDVLDSIEALDDYTFQFTLSEPRSYFDSILAFSTFHPVRLDVIEEFGDDWTEPGNFVSNGAYILAEHNPGDNLAFEKNETYWNADSVSIERIDVAVIGEDATVLAAFENGELDLASATGGGYPPEETSRLVEADFFVRLPRPGTYYLGMNLTAQHTNNVNFRRALSASIDKRTMLDAVLETPWRLDAYGVIPPEIVGHQGLGDVGYPFDVEAALGYLNDYMAEAGIEDPGDIVIELWYNKSTGNQQILEAVEAMWEANLGIDVRTVNVEWATYLETLEECNAIGGGGF